MSLTAKRLYQLLPAIIRQRDLAQGLPLQALLAVIAGQGQIFEDDLLRLRDNLFIETCDEWVVPYIGDLLGVQGLNNLAIPGFSQRARVANTLSYRRRKGTATMLEQLAHDTTGWPAHAVEFFQILESTQWLNHVRPQNFRTPDLRDTNALELVNTAFDTAAHTVDVRHIATAPGRYNIPNIGLFLWRLESYPLRNYSARAAASADGRYFFHPLGVDEPLFNSPQTNTDITQLSTEIDVPTPLRRRPLFDELEAWRAAIAAGGTPQPNYFGADPVLAVSVRLTSGGAIQAIPSQQLFISDLSDLTTGDWRRPVATGGGNPPNVAVDPVLGRLSFVSGVTPAAVYISAAHGFPGNIGGGPYDRRQDFDKNVNPTAFPLAEVDWQAGVSTDFTTNPAQNLYSSVAGAVNAWNTRSSGKTGVIVIVDNYTYTENLTGANQLEIGEGDRLLLVSADWPLLPVAGGGPGQTARQKGVITPANRRAHLDGNLAVEGTAAATSNAPGEFWIDGLLIEGSLTVANTGNANLGTLQVANATLVPSAGGLTVAGGNEELSVTLNNIICGPISLPSSVTALNIEECIIDVAGGNAIAAPGAFANIQASTLRGTVNAQELSAGNSIFTDLVKIVRVQTGCVRFCYILPDSETPRRYRCQPDLALCGAKTTDEQALILSRIVPMFTGQKFTNPAYLQLAQLCAIEIRTGADNGSEMGAWYFLCQPQRESNILSSLEDYLRLGLEAGLIFVT
jgi:hypothetical protein